jgi:hypothetical protein
MGDTTMGPQLAVELWELRRLACLSSRRHLLLGFIGDRGVGINPGQVVDASGSYFSRGGPGANTPSSCSAPSLPSDPGM